MAKRGCKYGRRKNGKCPPKKSSRKGAAKGAAKKCKFGVNKRTKKCLKSKRRRK